MSSTSHNQALIYHYFTLTDRQSQTSDALIRNHVYQLAFHNSETRDFAYRAVGRKGQETGSADYEQLSSVFKGILKIPSAVFIIIDALDESINQSETCAFLKELREYRPANTRVLVSSNTIQSLESESTLKSLSTEMVCVNPIFVNKDIETYVRELELGHWDNYQRDKIVSNLTDHSDGS